MDILNQAKTSFNHEFQKIARANVIRKLEKQGIDHNELLSSEFDELLESEIEILESDSKKVGTGIGIGLVLSMLIGI